MERSVSKTLATKPLKDDPLVTHAWNALFQAREVEAGAEVAERDADRLRDLVKLGLDYERDRRRYYLWTGIWRTTRIVLLYALAVAILGAGIGNAIYWPMKERANDYAHTDPGSVGDGALFAMQRFYGQNDMPKQPTMVSKSHDFFLGHPAWLTRWEAYKHKPVCIYVWGRNNVATPHSTYASVARCPRR
jgi:hypothetical protein